VRVVPNLYPAFPGQEVIVHGPDHVTTFAALSDETVAAVADAWRERERAHRAAGAAYLLLAVNEGVRAGASLEHSHSQLVPFDQVPPIPAAERTTAGSCALCAVLPGERARVVAEADGVVTLVPSWGRGPYELLVAPLRHRGDALAASAEPIAAALREAGRRLRAVAGADLAWNAWLHADPLAGPAGRHWHVELLPRLTVFAGIELGAGVGVNPVDADRAAEELRAAG
jgi:UDPglucose--hexose-1-phosphate uridylyltransferase